MPNMFILRKILQYFCEILLSLPSRECGLKLLQLIDKIHINAVTPLAGVWIEIIKSIRKSAASRVTPLAGVWIEI